MSHSSTADAAPRAAQPQKPLAEGRYQHDPRPQEASPGPDHRWPEPPQPRAGSPATTSDPPPKSGTNPNPGTTGDDGDLNGDPSSDPSGDPPSTTAPRAAQPPKLWAEGRYQRDPRPQEASPGPDHRWPEPPQTHAGSPATTSAPPPKAGTSPNPGTTGDDPTCDPSSDPSGTNAFSHQVRRSFGRRAGEYEGQAQLQTAIAWRLARHCGALPLRKGPRADLGAGSGLLSRALGQHLPQLQQQPPLQLDLCPELLACNPLLQASPGLPATAALVWDLNTGLPAALQGAALLASSFALQWLEHPAQQLAHWIRRLRPGGWLVLAVPTAGSFPQWRQAAARAGVPCTALALPNAGRLRETAQREGLVLKHSHCLRFSRPGMGGLNTLRHLQQLGAGSSRQPPLAAPQLRRLLQHWPPESPLTWEVLLLIGQRSS